MDDALKSYPARWSGPTLLACRKCQKKLKKSGEQKGLAKLGKTLRKRAKREAGFGPGSQTGAESSAAAPTPHLINVGCMDLCTKGGVAVCKPGKTGARLYVLRSVEDVFGL